MKYFLLTIMLCWLGSWRLYVYADRPSDDFGAGILALVAIVGTIVLTLIYVGMAFWKHAFL